MAVDLLAARRTDPDTTVAVHERARAEVARLRKVADDLTLFAAVPRVALAAVDAGRLPGQAAQAVAELAQDCGVQVRIALPPEPLPFPADEARLLSAVINLARNGIEAMGPGAFGEPLGAETSLRGQELVIAAERQAGCVEIAVMDRGAGLSPAVRDHLFEPFVTTKRSGTGLGLAIVRKIVEAHAGEVRAEERPGGGTIFRIRLPMKGGTR